MAVKSNNALAFARALFLYAVMPVGDFPKYTIYVSFPPSSFALDKIF